MSDVKRISQILMEAFRQIIPPPAELKATYKRSIARPEGVSVALEQFNRQAADLRRQHRLGVVSRARIVIALQREMNAAGYPPDLSRQVLFSLVVSAFIGKV